MHARYPALLLLSAALLLMCSQTLVASTSSANSASTLAPGLVPGQLAYVRLSAAGESGLYFADADGSNERAVRDRATDVVGWSPSGHYMAAIDESGVVILDATGAEVASISGGPSDHYAWSPGEDVLLVASEHPPAGVRLSLAAPDGSVVANLAAPKSVTMLATQPEWSPDGRQVLVSGCLGCNGTDHDGSSSAFRHLWLVNADGSMPRQLTHDRAVEEADPRWSADGRQILFIERCTYATACPPDAYSGTFVMNHDGSHRRFLDAIWDGRWSPDGKHLAFFTADYAGTEISPVAWNLMVGNPNGRDGVVIARGASYPYPLGWDRDGSRLFYQDDAGMWSVNADGSDPISFGPVSGIDQQFTIVVEEGSVASAAAASFASAAPASSTPSSHVGLPSDEPVPSKGYSPAGLAFDSTGALYVSDCDPGRIFRVVDPESIAVVAGSGIGHFDGNFSGDGGPATRAQIQCPYAVLFDEQGNLVISDHGNNRVRRVAPDGTITTIAGTGHPGAGWGGVGGDGGVATQANLSSPTAIAYGPDGTLYISDRDNDRIRAVSPDGVMTTFAGTTGGGGFSGDGGPASAALLDDPAGIAVAPDGTVYFADSNNERIRQVSPDGVITTIAGEGKDASKGNGGPALAASLGDPEAILLDPHGNLYVAEADGNRVRVITPDGLIHAFAGSGKVGNDGDGGPATKATLSAVGTPDGLEMDAAGNLYITSDDRIRMVSPAGIASTFAFGEHSVVVGPSIDR